MGLLRPVVFALLILVWSCGLPVHASKKKGTAATPPDLRILVTAVNEAKNQINIVYKRDGKKAVYTLDFLAKITVDNNPGTIKDIKAGQQVYGYIEHDAHSLDSVIVGIAQPAPVAPAKK